MGWLRVFAFKIFDGYHRVYFLGFVASLRFSFIADVLDRTCALLVDHLLLDLIDYYLTNWNFFTFFNFFMYICFSFLIDALALTTINFKR
jgi:hypothetical protein